MQRRPVRSSNVASVGWEPAEEGDSEGTLEVEFNSGQVYQYQGVSQSEYENLIGAASVGRYLNTNIIGHYDEQRVA